MHVLEQLLISKYGDRERSEDAIVLTDDFVCVIDGASSKSGRLWGGKGSGLMAALLLSDAVRELPRSIDGHAAIQSLTASIAAYYQRHDVYDELYAQPSERFTASVALYSACRRELWMVGDAQGMIDGQLYTTRMLIDDVVVQTRALYLELERLGGKSIEELMELDTGRAFVQPLIERQAVFQNSAAASPYAFGVIDGFAVPAHFIKTVALDTRHDELVLASDGYPDLKPTLAESEAALAMILRDDPLCMRVFKAVKGLGRGRVSYDDRAFVRLAL